MTGRVVARVLSIAGSDSGGGAGIQADLKTFAAHGVYGMTALTAVTAQDTRGVHAIEVLPSEIVRAQIDAVAGDLGIDAVKTGMLANARIIEVVTAACRRHGVTRLVVDPVMVATSGDRLLDTQAIDALRALLPLATCVTPNVAEAEILSGMTIDSRVGMERAGLMLLEGGAQAVLLKGGHIGDDASDLLARPGAMHWLPGRRRDRTDTHGTGCTLAAALAAQLAQGLALPEAARRAKAYVAAAIDSAPGLGAGHGPLWHGVPVPE